jgi:hypothetical protein
MFLQLGYDTASCEWQRREAQGAVSADFTNAFLHPAPNRTGGETSLGELLEADDRNDLELPVGPFELRRLPFRVHLPAIAASARLALQRAATEQHGNMERDGKTGVLRQHAKVKGGKTARKQRTGRGNPVAAAVVSTGKTVVAYLFPASWNRWLLDTIAAVLEGHASSTVVSPVLVMLAGSETGAAAELSNLTARLGIPMIDAGHLSDDEVETRLQRASVGVIVDPQGWLPGARHGISAAAAAKRGTPTIAVLASYAGTTGASHVGWMLADSLVAPPELQTHYSERLLALPGALSFPWSVAPREGDDVITREDADAPQLAGPHMRRLVGRAAHGVSPSTLSVWAQAARLAMGGSAILMRACILHSRFTVQNKQDGVKMTSSTVARRGAAGAPVAPMQVATGSAVIFAPLCLMCMENHGWNIQGGMCK